MEKQAGRNGITRTAAWYDATASEENQGIREGELCIKTATGREGT